VLLEILAEPGSVNGIAQLKAGHRSYRPDTAINNSPIKTLVRLGPNTGYSCVTQLKTF
jgi:hypothetical protein